VRTRFSTAQPTTLREYTSSTTARYKSGTVKNGGVGTDFGVCYGPQ
jgi:hypothetical protein